ncbi:hypothetical protein MOSE0_L07272 [Monosporozyma servazzii]
MTLLNQLVEERRKRISQLRGKYEDIQSDAIPKDKQSPEWDYLRVEDDSYTKQISDDSAKEEENKQEKGYDSDVSISSDKQSEEDHTASATKDLEIKLKPQINELEKRTEMALKRILRRNIMQNNVSDEIEETND